MPNTIYLCACGRRMSKYSRECKACYEVKKQGWVRRVFQANEILSKSDVILATAFGDYVLDRFHENLDAITYPVGKRGQWAHQRTFALHGGHVKAVLNGATRI